MTTHTSSISVAPADAGTRLDLFLVSQFPARSRSFLQQLIESGEVRVNGSSVKKHYHIKSGDALEISFKEEDQVDITSDPTVLFHVVHDAKDFAVIEKPAGVVMHPSHTHKKGTLVNGLLARWPELKGVGEDPLRPGIVHRLDKETSGLLVVAKTQPMFEWLKKQFSSRNVEKTYTALVAGKLAKKEGEITVPIGRLKARQIAIQKRNKRRSGNVSKSRNASTGFKVLEFYDGFTLVEAYPKTGRMHQIRVHFKHIGHPLAGDKTYAPRKVLSLLPLSRQFLHASALSFSLPDGEKAVFSSHLPKDLTNVLLGLEKKRDI
ncbi:MAG: RluA family pseudouridine synthase [Candidatus Azambacteria bacterium]|nr:RluA family pseudouridine synthase [Candidatus Azambacteria bacterium]